MRSFLHPLKPTVELGVLVPYPEEGREAKDHLRPSALRKRHIEKWERDDSDIGFYFSPS